jgi:Domain of unknown function (DUF4440)/Domain of unknown function (DUF3471)
MRMQSCVRLGLVLSFLFSLPLFAQSEKDPLAETILHQDGRFWDAYNRCDVDKMSQFFWPDVEFYHDKGGPTIGLPALDETLRKNLCGNPNFRLRREAIAETVKVYPLQKNGVTYGAVLSGEHYFYINDNGKPEYLDGMAKFFHVWLLKDGTWKMARIVSYDHHAPPYENKRKEITVAPNQLEPYVGKYDAPKSGTLVVARNNTLLNLTIGDKTYVLHPESETVFFTTDRDLTFEFIREGTKVSKIVVREHGAVVEEAKAE